MSVTHLQPPRPAVPAPNATPRLGQMFRGLGLVFLSLTLNSRNGLAAAQAGRIAEAQDAVTVLAAIERNNSVTTVRVKARRGRQAIEAMLRAGERA